MQKFSCHKPSFFLEAFPLRFSEGFFDLQFLSLQIYFDKVPLKIN